MEALAVLVETESLTKRYGDFAALDDCSLSVQHGEVFGLLGPNGAGKSTLLRLLMGFLQPSEGTARVDGLDAALQPYEVHQRVAYLPGDARLFRGMRGKQVLQFFADVRPAGDYDRSLHLAERLDLDLGRRVGFMSTGMRQKLALAATLAIDVPLMMLDEPTANLDPNVRREILALVAEAKDEGRTVIFSSHVLSEVEDVCDRVVILRDGKLVHTQDMHSLRRQHRIRAQLTGELPEPPAHVGGKISVESRDGEEHVTIDTDDELSKLLGWLATLPLAEVTIEPLGLEVVYNQYHAGEAV